MAANDPMMYDYQSLQTAFQTVKQFGTQVQKLGTTLTSVHDELQDHLSGDESGIGAVVGQAAQAVTGVAGKVFTEGGRVLAEMGTRGQTNGQRAQNTDETIAGVLQGINDDAYGSRPGSSDSNDPTGPADSPGSSDSPGQSGGDTDPLNSGDPSQEATAPQDRTGSDDPVDLATGEMFMARRDLELPGLLPLVFERVHVSGYRKGRWFGRSWAGTLDQRVEIDEDGIHYAAPDGVVLHYPVPTQPGRQVLPSRGARWPLAWDRTADTIRIEQPESGRTLHFPPGPTPDIARPLGAVTDRNGHRITFRHDEDGVPTKVYHSGGYTVAVDSFLTRGGPRILALRLEAPDRSGFDADGGAVVFGYDAAGRLTEVVNSSGLPYIYEYDDADRVTAWANRTGQRYEYHYDQAGRVVRTDGSGGVLAAVFEYDPGARATRLTDSLGHTTTYYANEAGQVVRVVGPLGAETLTERDKYGRVLAYTDPLGATTRHTLNEHGDPVRIERTDGSCTLIQYNELRLPTRMTHPDGSVWQYTYDDRGNLLTFTDAAGSTTSYTYDERGHLRSATNAVGQTVWFETDAAGLVTAQIDPLGARVAIGRDAYGRMTTLTDAQGAVCRFGYSPEGWPLWRVAPDGGREEWDYDAEGNLIAYRGPAGAQTLFEYGPFRKPVARTEPSGARYAFAYDTELRLTSVTDGQGLTWQYTYDPADNLVAETDFNGRTLTYRHDAAGRLIERTNGAGETATFVRDALGRVIERRAGEAGETGETGEYVHRFAFDPAGRLMWAENRHAVLEYTRDAAGRVLTEAVGGAMLAYEYDAVGRCVRRTTPAGTVSTWTYDAVGLPSALATAGGGLTFEHDGAGRETTRYLGPGAALSQAYDAAGRLVDQSIWAYEQAEGHGVEARLLQQRTTVYRPDGYPVEIADHLRGTRRYDLDPAGRVTAVTAATWTESYAYDASGNTTHAVRPGDDDTDGDREYVGTLIRRAGRTTYRRDAQGRLTSTTRRTLSGRLMGWQFAWDPDDRLSRAVTPEGAVWEYAYDPLGRRITKRRMAPDGTVAGETRFSWAGPRLAEQVASAPYGPAVATSWEWAPHGHRAVAQVRRVLAPAADPDTDGDAPTDDVRFYAVVTDPVGTPTELVAPDGRLAWHPTTGVWGAVIDAPICETDCPLRFPGQYHDAETGLDYNVFRYYDCAAGAYVSADPLGLAPAPNHFAYVGNPLAAMDPLGLAAGGFWHNTRKPIFGEMPDFGQTSLYMIVNPRTAEIRKFGVSDNPIGRYTQDTYTNGGQEDYSAGDLEMHVLGNFDTRQAALDAERYMTERWGGPDNDEPWANSVPRGPSWDEDLNTALDMRTGY